MAGMLPGVELARRRRTHHHHHLHLVDRSCSSREPPLRERLEPSSTMDEAALKARTRLEEKLGGFRSRLSTRQANEGRDSYHVACKKETPSSSAILEKGWCTQLDRSNSKREVCAICLDGYEAQQKVMNLPCSHKYHSECLLPWLSAHSHCPYCRTHVQS
ncbi:hypothetical protein HHK36_026769 [Tetracentron sinense]|uniref:RING-type domain-containing protein n=1 Tax=Tetracentron sinense TaxID=13715 RepID=A0A834YK23_TETSI|nr:hypothetical protein HHK36_026769 [Tetracentron sinense]